jgi:hypothetical protein
LSCDIQNPIMLCTETGPQFNCVVRALKLYTANTIAHSILLGWKIGQKRIWHSFWGHNFLTFFYLGKIQQDKFMSVHTFWDIPWRNLWISHSPIPKMKTKLKHLFTDPKQQSYQDKRQTWQKYCSIYACNLFNCFMSSSWTSCFIRSKLVYCFVIYR